MKTQIRTFITVSALVFAGVLNANAAGNFEEKNSGLISANESLTVLNEKISSFESELNGSIDYEKEAQLVTQWIADMAEAKATQRVMERGFVAPSETITSFENEVMNENNTETTDFREEALSITKSIADMEEAKAIQRVVESGYVSPVVTSNSFDSETTDFRKEALLITKSIADMEEAKAIERVMESGYVLPVVTSNSFDSETTDFGGEALLITKLIADKAEADSIQKLVAEGKLIANE